MSWKSILISIFQIVFMVGFLFVVVLLFSIETILGIIGIVVWLIVPSVLYRKALNSATGILDKVLAKYIAPIISAILVLGTIIYIINWALTA